MNKWVFSLIFLSALVIAALLYSDRRAEISEDTYIQFGLHHYLEARRGRTIRNVGLEITNTYRYPESETEIRKLFPDCCRFARHDPEGPQIAGWKRHWYQFGGYVLINAGLIKVEGHDVIPNAAPVIIVLDKKGRDITRKLIPK